MGLWAQLHRRVRSQSIALDVANAFNAVSCATIFANLAHTLPIPLPDVGKLNGRDWLSLLLNMDDGILETLLSRTQA